MAAVRRYPSVLGKPAYVLVLLAVVAGWDYPSAIARVLGKKQPTVSEQLAELKAAGLIRTGERTKAQHYIVGWDPLIYELQDLMNAILEQRGRDYRDGAFLPTVKRLGLSRILPPELFEDFLKHYFTTLREFRGIQKTFSEVCVSMFKALDELTEKELGLIAERYKADPALLKDVSALIGLEADHIEHLAFQSITDEISHQNRAGQGS